MGTTAIREQAFDAIIPLRSSDHAGEPVAADPATERLLLLAASVARTPSTVMLTGESGAGKEVVARYIHSRSSRASKPFVAINCAALPQSLLESELFGHEKGAFSGAISRHKGVFERANGGTLLLDEISEIPLEMQAKLLRVLQERTMFRVGGRESIQLDIRVIATSNRDLKQCVEEKTFRLDLYYRLNVFPLRVPALRERPQDISALTQFFVGKLNERFETDIRGLTVEAINKLASYGFPGNVRELLNILERAAILVGTGDLITADHILLGEISTPTMLPAANTPPAVAGRGEVFTFHPGNEPLTEVKRRVILGTLRRYDGNRTRTAEALGVSLRTVRNHLRKYRERGLQVPDYR